MTEVSTVSPLAAKIAYHISNQKVKGFPAERYISPERQRVNEEVIGPELRKVAEEWVTEDITTPEQFKRYIEGRYDLPVFLRQAKSNYSPRNPAVKINKIVELYNQENHEELLQKTGATPEGFLEDINSSREEAQDFPEGESMVILNQIATPEGSKNWPRLNALSEVGHLL